MQSHVNPNTSPSRKPRVRQSVTTPLREVPRTTSSNRCASSPAIGTRSCRQARELAESALVRLVHAYGDVPDFVLLGGVARGAGRSDTCRRHPRPLDQQCSPDRAARGLHATTAARERRCSYADRWNRVRGDRNADGGSLRPKTRPQDRLRGPMTTANDIQDLATSPCDRHTGQPTTSKGGEYRGRS